jgi:hypothetical protein
MGVNKNRRPPQWLFTVVAAGGFWASGVYVGMMRAGDATSGGIARAAAFGILGVLMLWGALGKR